MSMFEKILKTNPDHLLVNRPFEKIRKINNNRLVVVEEKNKGIDGALKEVTIEDIPDGSIAFSFDFDNQLSWLIYRHHPYANKKCDFVLISPGEGEHIDKHVFLYGDLKSKGNDEDLYKNQLQNTYLFTNYIIELVNNYHRNEINQILRHDINIVSKFVIITNSPDIERMPASSLMTFSSEYSNGDYMKTHEVLVHKAEQNQDSQNDISAKIVEKGVVKYQELLGKPSFWS